MIPKKAKDLIKPTAEITGSNEELIEDIVTFYWSEVRKALVNGISNNICVEGLGTFTARSDQLQALTEKYEKQLLTIEPVTFRKCEIRREIERKLSILHNIKDLISKEREKKEQVKQKRYGKDYKRRVV